MSPLFFMRDDDVKIENPMKQLPLNQKECQIKSGLETSNTILTFNNLLKSKIRVRALLHLGSEIKTRSSDKSRLDPLRLQK